MRRRLTINPDWVHKVSIRFRAVFIAGSIPLAAVWGWAGSEPASTKEVRPMASEQKAIQIAMTAVSHSTRYKHWTSHGAQYKPRAVKVTPDNLQKRLTALRLIDQ